MVTTVYLPVCEYVVVVSEDQSEEELAALQLSQTAQEEYAKAAARVAEITVLVTEVEKSTASVAAELARLSDEAKATDADLDSAISKV